MNPYREESMTQTIGGCVFVAVVIYLILKFT